MNWSKLLHFRPDEPNIRCPCCGACDMNEDFMLKMDQAREIAGIPFKINSGFRCSRWNARLTKGKRSTGRHTHGEALDLDINNAEDRAAVVNACVKSGLVSFELAKSYMHVDAAPTPWIGLL